MARVEYDAELIDEASVLAAVDATDLKRILAAPATAPAADDEHAGHDHAPGAGHDHAHGGFLGENTELYFAIASGVFWATGLALSFAGFGESLTTVLYVIAILLGGYFILIEAIETIRQGKFEIDFLMLVAAAGACALGEFQEAALLLFLFSIGHALENYAMGRARKSIAALSDLAPPTALVKRGGSTVEVGVAELQLGDTIVVRPQLQDRRRRGGDLGDVLGQPGPHHRGERAGGQAAGRRRGRRVCLG